MDWLKRAQFLGRGTGFLRSGDVGLRRSEDIAWYSGVKKRFINSIAASAALCNKLAGAVIIIEVVLDVISTDLSSHIGFFRVIDYRFLH